MGGFAGGVGWWVGPSAREVGKGVDWTVGSLLGQPAERGWWDRRPRASFHVFACVVGGFFEGGGAGVGLGDLVGAIGELRTQRSCWRPWAPVF